MEAAKILEEADWPTHITQDPAKQGTVVQSVDEFMQALFYGEHLNDVVVFPGGLKQLDQYDAMPEYLMNVQNKDGVRRWLESVSASTLGNCRAKLYYFDDEKEQWSVRKNDEGQELDTLLEKREELKQRQDNENIEMKSLYITELRCKTKYRHPDYGEWVKTILDKDVKDYAGRDKADMMLYWDRYDEGVFVGEKHSGSPMHVDQVLWSNIGKNWVGYKLLATWAYGDESNKVLENYHGKMFSPPLSQEEIAALESATKVCLVGPGDVFLFSGAVAHTTLCVGDGLSLTAYESFVNLNLRHAEVFLDTGTSIHFEDCRMDAKDVRNVKLDIADQVNDTIDLLNRGDVHDSEMAAAVISAVKLLKDDDFLKHELNDLHEAKKSKTLKAV